jgi:hypothetical protein
MASSPCEPASTPTPPRHSHQRLRRQPEPILPRRGVSGPRGAERGHFLRARRSTSTRSGRHDAAKLPAKPASFSAPSMGIDLEVKVLPEAGHSNRSEPQGRNREGPSGGSGERSRGPTYRNRIGGDAEQGERTGTREALVTKARRRISGGRAVKVDALTWGDLASRLKGRRPAATSDGARSQQRP